jgi:hypothetical protein
LYRVQGLRCIRKGALAQRAIEHEQEVEIEVTEISHNSRLLGSPIFLKKCRVLIKPVPAPKMMSAREGDWGDAKIRSGHIQPQRRGSRSEPQAWKTKRSHRLQFDFTAADVDLGCRAANL